MYSELEKIILAYPDKDWDFKWLSMNPNISLKFITNNPQFKWSYYYMSSHPRLTVDFIKENENKKWDMRKLSANKYLSIEFILNEINSKYWSKTKLSNNKTLTIEIIKKYLYIDWHWHNLTLNSCISVADISCNLHLPWGIQYILYTIYWPDCINSKINKCLKEQVEYINKKSIEVPNNIETLYYENDTFDIYNINWRGDITLDIIKNNINYPWDFRAISDNQFDYEYKSFTINKIKKWYKRLKLSQLYSAIAEVLIIEQMKPDGKYMTKLMQSWDLLE